MNMSIITKTIQPWIEYYYSREENDELESNLDRLLNVIEI